MTRKDPPDTTPRGHLRAGLEAKDPATRLAHIRHLLELLEQAQRSAVAEMRLRGDSWTEIAQTIGTTRQAAHTRFARDPAVCGAERLRTMTELAPPLTGPPGVAGAGATTRRRAGTPAAEGVKGRPPRAEPRHV